MASEDKEKKNLCICMGSSCFARGNEKNLGILEDYISKYRLQDRIELSGSRCEGRCCKGPNVLIDGVIHTQVESGCLLDLLDQLFKKGNSENNGPH
ncbi:MAG: (2Fe-2S) ferredoxin domain-containing protein [Ignavibacteria bacterium]|jgi:NADH:ubiquinone oxidoreductase subunit E|nr:(2Fe-2S) ferredoxin domain-containing protein [Ignavibacteria bacterium]MCU7504590.1 (2Fe-2S) ferredoxin domain-containing protein [Ignavibacteria bacterium]MCU7516572.1 (2Fe-2S) ferredoxin domain-containing protein [Ignavibacteria bacterium]